MDTSEVKAIAVIEIVGERDYTLLFAESQKNIDDAITQNKVYESADVANEYVMEKKVISRAAINHLVTFLRKECLQEYPDIPGIQPVHILKIITAQKVYNCFLTTRNKAAALDYLSRLQEWLQHSPYDKEYDDWYGIIKWESERLRGRTD
ncbi:hypothetical protein [Edaphocola flava]|uniref:hypothetical protein n=1 Tax=Edaphocola flava TaxID=2499629 RepID=UPI00100B54CE|nr:hypothetical protein [Edaphocola flava]